MSPSSASTARSLTNAFEFDKVLGHLAVDLESAADEGISSRKSPCNEITTGGALFVVAIAGPMVNVNVGAIEGDQLAIEPSAPIPPSPGRSRRSTLPLLPCQAQGKLWR